MKGDAAYVRWTVIASAACLSALAVLLASGDAWRVPFQYGDDLMLVVQEPRHGFYLDDKVKSEGRWLVWGWHRFVLSAPASFNFLLALGLWCAAMALFAWRLAAGTASLAFAVTLALAFNPHALMLMLWPNTTAPMMVVLVIAAALVVISGNRIWCLATATAAGVMASMLAMQLFGFLIIAGALCGVVAHGLQLRANSFDTLKTGTAVIAAGVVGGLVGTLFAFVLNWLAFGIFGFEIAEWRYNSVGDAGRVELALQNIVDIVVVTVQAGGGVACVLACAAIAIMVFCSTTKPSMGVAFITVIGVMLAVTIIPLATGTPVPSKRGGIVFWYGMVAAIVFVGIAFDRRLIATIALLVSTGSTAGGIPSLLAKASKSWQADISLLNDIEGAVSAMKPGASRMVVVGDGTQFELLPEHSGFSTSRGDWWFDLLLTWRFEGEFQLPPKMCRSVAACPDISEILEAAKAYPAGWPDPNFAFRVGDVLVVKLGHP